MFANAARNAGKLRTEDEFQSLVKRLKLADDKNRVCKFSDGHGGSVILTQFQGICVGVMSRGRRRPPARGFNSFAEGQPPGPPPRPGLSWKSETHRWIRPDGTDE